MLVGQQMYGFVVKLWHYCRSLTGEGVRKTLNIINEILPLKIYEVPTGTKAFDWEVPDEWNIYAAYIKDEMGNTIVDMNDNNLHIMGYSVPTNAWMDLEELQKHLYSDPEKPNAIPYHTSYYDRKWGFCLEDRKRVSLKPGKYHVVIDSSLNPGHLTYGECVISGKLKKEVLLSTYICHPSMANNELSGPALATYLGRWLLEKKRKYTYRIIYIPETIGALVYLKYNYKNLKKNTISAVNISCVGDDRCYTYIASRYGNTLADKIAKHVLHFTDPNYYSYSFLERGSNERMFCAPGFDLPMVNISRSMFRKYPEYHTSLDNLSLVSPQGFQNSFDVYMKFIEAIENNTYYIATNYGEPRLGNRNLYAVVDNNRMWDNYTKIIVDFLQYADGSNDLIEIANIIKVPIWKLYDVISVLLKHKLILDVRHKRPR